mmetsp:Transcript_39488/g.111953  ORF Transcript_39488/g.111953 Transcript_39488/m.111953 type:complete len:132 (+) Transcript_39488:1699-2094(+)
MLVRVKALPGLQRTEVLQIAEVFRANVMDMGLDSIILSVVGDPGKLVAFQRMLSTYGILEDARTGRIALLRGQERLMGGGWGDSKLYQKRTSTNASVSELDDFATDVHADGDVYAVGDSVGDFIGEGCRCA